MDQYTPNNAMRDIGHTSLHSSSIPPDKVPVGVPTEMTQPQLPAMAYMEPWNYLRLGEIESAGITWQEAQRLNALRMEYALQSERQYVMHLQTLNFMAAKQMLMTENSGNGCAVNGNGMPLAAPTPTDFRAFVPEFIACRWLCKTRSTTERTGWRYLIYNPESRRHAAILEKDLRFEFDTFVYERVGDAATPTTTARDHLFQSLLHSIPLLDKSGYRVLSSSEISFTNGIYDLATGYFNPYTQDTVCFSMFSMLFPFNPSAPNPDAFDGLLADMFGEKVLMQLAYEIVGALLAPGATLKRIYVFQGVSQGGRHALRKSFSHC